MKVKLEDKGRLKISLDVIELAEYNLTYNQIDYSLPKTRLMLNALLKQASELIEFKIESGKLLIEVFPEDTGGCTIYFTVFEKTPKQISRLTLKHRSTGIPYIFEFRSSSDMLSAIVQLYSRKEIQTIKSHLYFLKNQYRLMLYPSCGDKITTLLAGEYADTVLHSSKETAYTCEYGRLISGDRAVEIIGSSMSKNKKKVG